MLTNQIIEAGIRHTAKIKNLCKPYNLRTDWNLFKFNSYSVQDAIIYNRPYKTLQTLNHFCEGLRGMTQPGKAAINVSLAVFDRLSYIIIQKFGVDKIPQWICCAVYRYDKKIDWKEAQSNIQKGKHRYFIAILEEREFDIEWDNFVKKGKKEAFRRYINWDY